MPNHNRYMIEMKISVKPCTCMMELDTAADFLIMSKSEYPEKCADLFTFSLFIYLF